MTPEEPVVQTVQRALAAMPVGAPLVVAFSGGIDSTALLHACIQAVSPEHVLACHVHHGLQPAADAFAGHCAPPAAPRGGRRARGPLTGPPGRGGGGAGGARVHRYQALFDCARAAQAVAVLTAHHADDQAETLLIGLARGSGVDGLSGIHAEGDRDGVRLLRPLLAVSRTHLDEYCARYGLRAVHDPMNADLTLLRSALRAKVMPVLRDVVPGFAANAARSAGLIAEAAQLAIELAQSDLTQAVETGGALNSTSLVRLSRVRQANAIRQWLRARGAPVPSQARLSALLAQTFESRSAHALWRHAGWSVVRYRDRLQALPPHGSVRPDQPAPGGWVGNWSGESLMQVPGWEIALQFEPASSAGQGAFLIERAVLEQGPIVVDAVGARVRVRPGPRASSREVRKRWQELGVPPWLRAWLPEVQVAGRPLGVVALGVSAMGVCSVPAAESERPLMAVSVRLLSSQDPRSAWVLSYN
ncbi:MAG: tRNA lysidine(34) synthetase TilS [Burkholderiaceae bacterium]